MARVCSPPCVECNHYSHVTDNQAVGNTDSLYAACRLVIERGVALLLLLAVCPLVLFLAAMVRFTSPGPAFYGQVRVGRYGRHFRILKLRTMTHNCELASGPVWSGPSDCRVTPFGRFLRQMHLDELPQLVNVVRGEMSLIGPRPERPEMVQELELALPEYRCRLLVLPGMTGLAQMHLPADIDLSSVQQKLKHDLYYVNNLSFLLDLRIACLTGLYFVTTATAAASQLLLRSSSAAIDDLASPRSAGGVSTIRSHIVASNVHSVLRAA